MKYLVTIQPLEPYTFGIDQGVKYPGEKSTGRESYFIRSREIPEQTAILGLLRYLVLQEKKLLRTDFHYSFEERREMANCIGEQSFRYGTSAKQDFGSIHSISPVFLMNEREEILIRNPYNNKAHQIGYCSMEMEDGIETSAGTISLPAAGEYDAKSGYGKGYINLETKEIITDLFGREILVGNRKNDENGEQLADKSGNFFKRELIRIKKGYSFAVFTEVDALPAHTIGYMGKKKSAFLIQCKQVENIELSKLVENAFKDVKDVWYYALSDLVLRESITYGEFCIVEEKYQRNLETVYEESGLKKLKKSEVRYHLVQSGSVFYKSCDLNIANENCKQIGYNQLVQLGGN